MRQFDVVAAPAAERGLAPFVVILQSDLLVDLRTRLAAPFFAPEQFRPIRHLNPIFEFEGASWMMATQMMAAVPIGELDDHVVASLAPERETVIRAIDFLLVGV